MSATDLAAIEAALDELPGVCRYHGTELTAPASAFTWEACCDTGRPALRRLKAEAALERLRAELPQAWDDGFLAGGNWALDIRDTTNPYRDGEQQ